jgi:PAS domain S-box-containing protein
VALKFSRAPFDQSGVDLATWTAIVLLVVSASIAARYALLARSLRRRVDKATRESATFRNMVEKLPLATYVDALDEASSALYMSPHIEDLLGYTVDEWLDDPELFPKLLHPDDRERVLAGVARSNATGERFCAEYRMITKDGRSVWFRDECLTVCDPDGSPIHSLGYLLDITERKDAEQKAERMATFPRSSPNPIIELRQDGAIAFVNAATTRMLEQLELGQAEEILPADVGDIIGRLLASDRNDLRVETQIRGRILSWLFFAIPEQGSIHCYIDDVSEARRAEDAVADREERFRTLVSNVPGIVYRCSADAGWTMEFISDDVEEVTGYPPSDYLRSSARSWESIMHPDDREWVREEVEASIADGRPYILEFRIVHASGEVRWVWEQGRGVRGPDGEVLWLDGAIFDITARKRAEQELAQQNERLRALDTMKDEFLALVSHELRTPLTSILGYLELILDDDEGPLTEEQRRYLGIVDRASQRLLRLVGDLLLVAQIEAGELALEPSDADLATLASECVETQLPRAEIAGVKLMLEIEPVPVIQADTARIGQLIDNLVSNAIKFTPAGGSARVGISAEYGRVVIEVADSGIGIPEEEKDKLFQRFFRSSSATSLAIPGTGLGLTITRAIVESHGGTISYESEEGVGTTFRVELPLLATRALDRASEFAA